MGFGFKVAIQRIEFEKGKMTKDFQKKAEIQMRHAAREWLRALIIRIPVWTGMARGAFKFAKGRSGDGAGRFLGEFLNVQIPIDPVDWRPSQNPELGGKQSRFTFSFYENQFRFTYNTDVRHLILNDFYHGSSTTGNFPWGGFEAGEAAFKDYLNTVAKEKLRPKLKDYTTIVKARLSSDLRSSGGI